MSTVPIVASVADIPAAVRLAERNHGSRAYVAKRMSELGHADAVPSSWGITAGGPSAEARDEAADKGQALPDGSFPIRNVAELKKAIKAYGRAKNKAAAKRHIIKRARALGSFKLLPDDWDTATTASAMTFALTAALAPLRSQGAGALGEELLAEAIRTGVAVEVGLRSDGAILFDLAPGYVERNAIILAAGWDDSLHPRGRDGKYITKGGIIHIFEGKGFSKPSFTGEAIGVKHNDTGDYITVRATSPGKAPGGKEVKVGEEVSVRSSDIASAPPAKAKIDAGREKFVVGDTVRIKETGEEAKVTQVQVDGSVMTGTGPDAKTHAPGEFEMARRVAREGENEVGVPQGETPEHPSAEAGRQELSTGAAKYAKGDTVRAKDDGQDPNAGGESWSAGDSFTVDSWDGEVIYATDKNGKDVALIPAEVEMSRRVKRDGEKTEGPSKMPTQSEEERTITSPKVNQPGANQPKLDEASSAQLDKELRESLDALGIDPDAEPEANVADDPDFQALDFAVENILFEQGLDTETNPEMLGNLIEEEFRNGNKDPQSVAAKAADQIGFGYIGGDDDAEFEAEIAEAAENAQPDDSTVGPDIEEPSVPDMLDDPSNLAGLTDDELKSRLMDAAVAGDTETLTNVAAEISARKAGATQMGGPEDDEMPEYDGSAHDQLDVFRTNDLKSEWMEGDPDPDTPEEFAKAVLGEAVQYQAMNLDDDQPEQDDELNNYMASVQQALQSGTDDYDTKAADAALELRAYLIEEGYSEDSELPNLAEGPDADHGVSDELDAPAALTPEEQAFEAPVPDDIKAIDDAENANPIDEIEQLVEIFNEGSDDPADYPPEAFAAWTKVAEDAGRHDLVEQLDNYATNAGVYDGDEDGAEFGDDDGSASLPFPYEDAEKPDDLVRAYLENEEIGAETLEGEGYERDQLRKILAEYNDSSPEEADAIIDAYIGAEPEAPVSKKGGPLPLGEATAPTDEELETEFPTMESLQAELESAIEEGDSEYASVIQGEIERRNAEAPVSDEEKYLAYEAAAIKGMKDAGMTDEQIDATISNDATPFFADEMDSGVDAYGAGKSVAAEMLDKEMSQEPIAPGPGNPDAPAPIGNSEAAKKIGLMAQSAMKPTSKIEFTAAQQEIADITGDPNLTNDERHSRLAKLMTALALGGKQRKRYRELLDEHLGNDSGDSAPVAAKAVADGLSDDNPLKSKLEAKAAGPDIPDVVGQLSEGMTETPDGEIVPDDVAAAKDAELENGGTVGDKFNTEPLVRTDDGYSIAGVGFKKNSAGEWVDDDGTPGVRADIVERLRNEAAKDAIRDKIASLDAQIAEVDKKLAGPVATPAVPTPEAPKPTESVPDIVADFPAPAPGAKVYEHPMGAKIYVNPDGSMEAYGKDGKKKKTSATPEKLAAGHGTWVETTGQAAPAAAPEVGIIQGPTGEIKVGQLPSAVPTEDLTAKPAPKPIPPGNPEAAIDALQDLRSTLPVGGGTSSDDWNVATAVRYLGYAVDETGADRQKSIDVAVKTLRDVINFGSLTEEQRAEAERVLEAMEGKA